MKKTLALFIALITILSVALVSCNDKTPPAATNDDDEDVWVDKTNNNNNTDTSDTDTGDNKTPSGVWSEKSGTVYVMANGLYVRKEANTSGGYYKQVNIGDSFAFTATDGDWYKITYEGGEGGVAYLSAKYVTEDKNEATFTSLTTPETLQIEDIQTEGDDDYQVCLRDNAALQAGTSDQYIERADTLEGELKKTAVNGKGNIWEVEYKGTKYYIGVGAFQYFDNRPNTSGGGNGVG